MTTKPEAEPTVDRLAEARLSIEAGLRETITGAPDGSIRLYVLMGVVAACLVIGGAVAAVVGLVSLVALILDGGRGK